MTLTTTPGSASADSYCTLAEADAYFSDRGVAAWTGTDDVKEKALRVAAGYLDNQYRTRWLGIRSNETQSLAWPRQSDGNSHDGRYGSVVYAGILDEDGYEIATDVVPTQVKRAQMEVALLHIQGITLEPRLERGGAIAAERKRVGPIEKEVEYESGATPRDRFLVVEGLLNGLTRSHPGSSFSSLRIERC